MVVGTVIASVSSLDESVDSWSTGMGLDTVSSILQGVCSTVCRRSGFSVTMPAMNTCSNLKVNRVVSKWVHEWASCLLGSLYLHAKLALGKLTDNPPLDISMI